MALLLACVLLLAVPSAAMAATRSDTANTYYSNINGWNFTLTNTFSASGSTQWKITGVSLRAHLTADTTNLGPLHFRNLSGTVGPMYVTLKSGSTTAYSNQCSATHTLSPGSTSTHSWAPNVLTRVNSTYGTAKVYWTQKCSDAPFPGSSSKNPCTLGTATY